tara:strand:- start:412 stop:903 length:492 start_codon:yes stop_codon:yes gene_type:complete
MEEITIYPSIEEEEFNSLLSLLSSISVPRKTTTNNRRNFPARHRAMTLGIVKGRFNGITELSYYSKKFPEIYQEVLRIGKLSCPFEFKSIQLNHNVVCPPHFDSKNASRSVLVSFGDYTGCKIVINDKIYDARHTPIEFDGRTMLHWNTNDLVGNKYSLVFFQ